MDSKKIEIKFANKDLALETGSLAFQSTGSVLLTLGDNVFMANVTISEKGKENAAYFPLVCDYEEKFYAGGKIKGSRFIKREGRPSDEAVITSRLIDRPIRPLFPKGTTNDVQIIVNPFSLDKETPAGSMAITAAGAALFITGAPIEGPVAGVRIGMENGEFILEPSFEQIENGDLDLVVAGTPDAITMVEAGANEIPEDKFLEALDFAHKHIKELCLAQIKLKDLVNPEPIKIETKEVNEELKKAFENIEIEDVTGKTKSEVKKKIHSAEDKVREKFAKEIEEEEYTESDLFEALQKKIDKKMREKILEKGERIDGRKPDEIRPITCKVGLFNRTHGTGLFQRGETQVLTFTTLGGPGEAQIIDTPDLDIEKRYIHHYNFPPYSVGDIRMLRGTSRREIGHGMLAERALFPMIPAKDDFPYTMRLVSEVLSCNGSSSMASVCGSTLSLMDSGVPIKKPVSGIAMGLVIDEETGKYQILSDIQGFEDFAGDMDFKVCGTKDGITAIQMDIKVKGLKLDLLKEALEKAKKGRLFILDKMLEVISTPRENLSQYAPMLIKIQVDPSQVGDVIGKGGETIKKIVEECDVKIDIEDDGLVIITAENQENGEKAKEWIKKITYVPKVGDILEGRVTKILDFGAFMEYAPGKEGMIHISKLENFRVNKVEDVVKPGDQVKAKVLEIDSLGRLNLSRAALLPRGDSQNNNDFKGKGRSDKPKGGGFKKFR